jgi:outer membrane protein OmpA-like peptidoglycan-associated protein
MLCVIDTKVCSAEKSVAVGSQAPSETKKRSDSENSGAEKSDSEKFDSAPSADSAPASAGADLNPEYSKIETASDVFAKILTETTVDDLQNGESLTAPKDGDLTLDMRELFGLKGKSAQEVVEWIYANSTEFAAGGYRKIRFVMASSVYISGGSLNLSVTTKPDAPQAEAAGKRVHENDDDAIKIESNTPTVTQPSDMDVSVSKRWSDKELLTMKSSGITQIGKKIAAHADSIKSILITGARDRSGSKEVNDRLGLDHAKKVANALIAGLKQGKNTEELIKAITAKSGGVVSETDSKCGKTANCPEDRTVTLSITLKEGLSSNQANELKNTLNSELSGQ